mmetsp:Transcript_31839/g.93541  ORF Transcript_31839/g.93541 Transcript_31839/m.93541 type:complete len:419 (+) Transcript_31839:855-2111(+)
MDDGIVVVRFRLGGGVGVGVGGTTTITPLRLVQRLHGPEAVLGELGRGRVVRLGPRPDDGVVRAGGRLEVGIAAALSVAGGELPQQPLGAVGPRGIVGAVGVRLDDGRVGVGVGDDGGGGDGGGGGFAVDHPAEEVLGHPPGVAAVGFGVHRQDLGVGPDVEEVGDLPLHLAQQIREAVGSVGLVGVAVAPRLQQPAVGAIPLPFRVEPGRIGKDLVGRLSELGQLVILRRVRRMPTRRRGGLVPPVSVAVFVFVVERANVNGFHRNVRPAGQEVAPRRSRGSCARRARRTVVDSLVVKNRPRARLAARRGGARSHLPRRPRRRRRRHRRQAPATTGPWAARREASLHRRRRRSSAGRRALRGAVTGPAAAVKRRHQRMYRRNGHGHGQEASGWHIGIYILVVVLRVVALAFGWIYRY